MTMLSLWGHILQSYKLYGLWQCYHCGVIFTNVIYCMGGDNAITVGQYSTRLYIVWFVTMLSLWGNILYSYKLYGLWQWCYCEVIFYTAINCMVFDNAITVGSYLQMLYIAWVVTMMSLCGNILNSYILYWLWQYYHCGVIFYKVLYCMVGDNAIPVGHILHSYKLYALWQCYHCGAIFYTVINCMVRDNTITVGQYSTKLYIVFVVTMLSLWGYILQSFIFYGWWQCYHSGTIFYKVIYLMGCDNANTVG